MSMIRWSPMRSVFHTQSEVGRLIDEVLSGRIDPETKGVLQPAVDIEESPEGYLVRAELPGMKLEDIKITLADNELVVRGEKRREVEKKDATYHRTERVYGQFERTFSLSHAVSSDKIEATYRDGVLEVSIPKAEEAKAREIPIKTSR